MSATSERKLRDLEGTREVRDFAANLELREDASDTAKLTGWASVVDTPYPVRDFTETIKKGAWRRTLLNKPDVVLLVNHEGLPLARTTSGTLALSEDARGLRVEADLDRGDPDVQSLLPKMRRGDLTEMSFAFSATGQEWSKDRSQRTITEVSLHKGDVSLVARAANPAAVADVRKAGGHAATPVLSIDELRAQTRIARARWAVLKLGPAKRTAPTRPVAGATGTSSRFNLVELKTMAKEGKAWQNQKGEWVAIASADDLKAAIAAVGLEPALGRAVTRRKIINAARVLGLGSVIPKTWNSDGSLNSGRSAAQMAEDTKYRHRLLGERLDRRKRDREARLRRRGR